MKVVCVRKALDLYLVLKSVVCRVEVLTLIAIGAWIVLPIWRCIVLLPK
jgi:hypothetical protein